jgi:hypothetical protein
MDPQELTTPPTAAAAWSDLEHTAVDDKEEKHKTKLNSVALVRERTIPTDRRLLAKIMPTFADRGCRVVSAAESHGR